MVGTAIGLKLSIKFPRQLEQIRFVASAPDNLQAQRHPRIIHAHRQADRRQVRDIGKASVICLIGRCILAMRESALWRSRQDDGSVFGDDILHRLCGFGEDRLILGPVGIAALWTGSSAPTPPPYENALKEGLEVGLDLSREEREFHQVSKGLVLLFHS
mgnify:CR=1 FL=1